MGSSGHLPFRSSFILVRSSSILVVFHFGRLPFWFVFHFGCLPFWSSSILVVFSFGCLPFWSSSILVVFHFGRLPFWSSSILVVFHFGQQKLLGNKLNSIRVTAKLSTIHPPPPPPPPPRPHPPPSHIPISQIRLTNSVTSKLGI